MKSTSWPRTFASRAVILAAAGVLGACANLQPTESGALGPPSTYRALQPIASGEPGRAVVTGLTPAGSRVYVGPVEVAPTMAGGLTLDEARRSELSHDATGIFKLALSRSFKLADAPESSATAVRVVLTDLKQANTALNAATLLLIGPVSNGGASLEVKVAAADTAGREPVATLVYSGGDSGHLLRDGPFGFYSRDAHVKASIGRQAERVRLLMLGELGIEPGSEANSTATVGGAR